MMLELMGIHGHPSYRTSEKRVLLPTTIFMHFHIFVSWCLKVFSSSDVLCKPSMEAAL